MCIMIYLPAGVDFPIEHAQAMYRRNSDGLGIVWASRGKLHTRRALPVNSVDAQAMLINWLADSDGSPRIVHFRFATHGTVTLGNVHPFRVPTKAGRLMLAHNGVLPWDGADGLTDTQYYIDAYLAPLLSVYRDPIAALSGPLGDVIGSHIAGSKFAIMDRRGSVAVVNEGDGKWVNGAWYSNLHWQPSPILARPPPRHAKRYDPVPGYDDSSLERWDSWRYRYR